MVKVVMFSKAEFLIYCLQIFSHSVGCLSIDFKWHNLGLEMSANYKSCIFSSKIKVIHLKYVEQAIINETCFERKV